MGLGTVSRKCKFMFHQAILTIVILTANRPAKFQTDFREKAAGKFLNLDFNGQSFSKKSNRAFGGLVARKFLNLAFNRLSSRKKFK